MLEKRPNKFLFCGICLSNYLYETMRDLNYVAIAPISHFHNNLTAHRYLVKELSQPLLQQPDSTQVSCEGIKSATRDL